MTFEVLYGYGTSLQTSCSNSLNAEDVGSSSSGENVLGRTTVPGISSITTVAPDGGAVLPFPETRKNSQKLLIFRRYVDVR